MWLVASVWVMLHMRVKVHSPTPPRAVAVRDVSLSQLASHIHQFANCHRARTAAAVRYCTWVNWYLLTLRTLPLWDEDPDIAGRLFNGLTANDRRHRIYRSQQRSLSLGKGLMLAETVAQTDGQTLPIFIYRYMYYLCVKSNCSAVNFAVVCFALASNWINNAPHFNALYRPINHTTPQI